MRLVGGQRERAEDLVQEACLRAFRNYERLCSPEKIKSWFFQILVNTHINEFHRRSHEPPILDVELSETLLESAGVEPAPTPEEMFFGQLLDIEIQQALDALPIEFRTVIWLSDIVEAEANLAQTQAARDELAQAIGFQVHQADNQLHSAIEAVRANEQVITQAREALRLAQLRYRVQLASFVELTAAEAAAASAEAEYAQSLYGYKITEALLRYASGRRPTP
jgi:RNA polymerase sigma factor (sigma-70 family)